jgi:short-subunit dehydrogenase
MEKARPQPSRGALKPATVVTGASSGIGRELARAAARDGAGHAMLLIGLEHDALAELAAEMSAAGVEAHALAVDLSGREAGACIESKLAEIGAYCDVLVNSAGFGVFGAAADADRRAQLDLIEVNIRALTEMTLRFLPGMIDRGRGGVLNVGSITGYLPGPNMATYFAAKAYVGSFTAALAQEVRGSGVTVTCLTPGVVRTPFFARCGVGQTRLYKMAPHGNAPAVAAAGWRGFRAGKRLVIPRLVDRIIVGGSLLVPQALLLRFVSAFLRPP